MIINLYKYRYIMSIKSHHIVTVVLLSVVTVSTTMGIHVSTPIIVKTTVEHLATSLIYSTICTVHVQLYIHVHVHVHAMHSTDIRGWGTCTCTVHSYTSTCIHVHVQSMSLIQRCINFIHKLSLFFTCFIY